MSVEACVPGSRPGATLHRDYYLSGQVFAAGAGADLLPRVVLRRPGGGDPRAGRLPGARGSRRERAGRPHPGRRARGPLQRLPPPRLPAGARRRRTAPSAAASAAPITPGPTPSRARCAPRRSSRRATGWPGATFPASGRRGVLGRVRVRAPHARRGGSRAARRCRRSWAACPSGSRAIRWPSCGSRTAHRLRGRAPTGRCCCENYNECYHCGPVHPELCGWCPAFRRARRRGPRLGAGHSPPRRRLDTSPAAAPPPARRSRAERGRAGAPQGRAGLSRISSLSLAARARRGVHPLAHGPERTRASCATSSSIPTRWPSRGSIPPTRWSSGTS